MRGVPSTFGIAVLVAVSSVLMPGSVVQAHHSIAGLYDDSHPVTLDGIVTLFKFVNPHPLVVLEVEDKSGNTQRWVMEMDSRWELSELGFQRDTLKPGDHLVVIGSLARRQPHSLYIRKIDRPSDGFSYEHHP